MKHFINVSILVVALTAILMILVDMIEFMPLAASAESAGIDWLFGLHIDVIVFLYALVNGVLLYSVFVFRRKPGDVSEGAYFHSNTGLEILWTIIPLAVVLYFAYLGAGVLNSTTRAEPDELNVIVTGRQWSWTFEYPEWDIISTEMVLPVGRPTRMQLESEDVLHSFWVPEFRVKQDTVPGQTQNLRITPTIEGVYKIRCAELCGTSHAYMLADINVVSAEEFEIWRQKKLGIYVPPEGEQGEELDPITEGTRLADGGGCLACHSVDGSALVGPTWAGVFGSTEALEDGSSATVDEDYLRQSIVDPGAQIVSGYTNVMPANYGDLFNDAEIGYIIEYIKSLQ